MSYGNNKTILLVEDEVIIALSEKAALEEYGYNVITANTGEKALKVFKDLILMDINLGERIDGTETAEIILKTHDVPIVFLSNHTEPEVVEKTEKITSYGYIVKNSGITILDASIKMAFKLFEANKIIQESEIKQKALISNISDVISIISPEGIIKYESPNIGKLFGWQPQDVLVNNNGLSRVHPDDIERIKKDLFSIIQKDDMSIKVEFRYKCKDGSYKPIELTAANLVNDPIIEGVLLNFHDITERKMEEYILRKSEEKYRNIFENAEVGMFRTLYDGSEILDMNEKFLKVLGYEREEIVGKPSIIYWAVKEERNRMLKLLEAEGKVTDFECSMINRSGEIRNCITSLKLYRSEGILEGSIYDITEHKKLEETLRENEKLLQQIVKHDPLAIAVHDRNMCYIAASDRWLNDYNVKESDIIGKSHYEVFPEIPQRWRDIHKRCLNGAVEHNDDDYFERPDGSVTYNSWEMRPWYKLDGSIGGVISYTEVTTERKLAELARKSVIERCNLATLAGGFGVWERDIQKNHLLWDDRMYELYRIKKGDTLTYDVWVNSIYFEDKEFVIEELQKALRSEKEYNTEYRIILPDKTIRNIKTNAYIIRNPEGEPLRIIGVNYDITERKQSEEKIKKLLNEKDIILKEVHHRIKNFMNTIYSLHVLQANTLKDFSAISAIQDAGSRIKSMMLLYDKLYQSTGVNNMLVKDYLSTLVDEIVVNFPNFKSVNIEKTIDDFVLDIKTLQSLGIIVNELLTNILKYAFTGRNEGLIKVSALIKNNNVSIIVEDNGKEIPESVGFENSTGFGLKLVGMMVQQIDGSIRIERGSSPRVGTKIILDFEK